MPPSLEKAPTWLPEWIESHIGMKIDADGRAERLHAGVIMPVPDEAHADLRAWLERGLSRPQQLDD